MVPAQGTDHQVHACSFCSALCKICLDAVILLCGKESLGMYLQVSGDQHVKFRYFVVWAQNQESLR
jgi:hypothetical protein